MNYYKEQKKSSALVRIIAIAMTIMMSGGCYAKSQQVAQASSNSQDDIQSAAQAETAADPYEGFNRVMFKFNDTIDSYLLKPVAKVYNVIVPRPINQGVHNFFNNISNIPTIANDVLQLNMYQATRDTWRLVINSTVGIGGLFDIAARIDLPQYSNDFGMTLAYWGYKNSHYLVLPLFGPSTVRDGIGLPVDYFGFSLYPYVEPTSTRYQLYALGVIDRRAQLLQFESVLEEAALDKYTFIRDAYMQRRAYQLEQNQHVGFADRVNAAAQTESGANTDQTKNTDNKMPEQSVPKTLAPEGV